MAGLAWAAAALVLFACYLRLADTQPVNSDGAGNALAAWDMLHGNPLLAHWGLTDVSFYTTALPEYLLVEVFHPLNPGVVHVGAALTYTLVLLLAARLAKGNATGGQGLARAALAGGIMLAPQLGHGVATLISSPDHIGTAAPLLAVALILDRARPRWHVPALVGLILCWAAVADPLALYVGAAPLAAVSVLRCYRRVAVARRPAASCRYEIGLAVAAAGAAWASGAILGLIAAHGGFRVLAPSTLVISAADLPRHLAVALEGLLLLGGGDFFGIPLGPRAVLAGLHLVGVALAGWAAWLAARRLLRGTDLAAEFLVTAVIINVAAYVLSARAPVIAGAREINVVLPFCAALAGRLLIPRLLCRAAAPLLALTLAGYLAGLAHEVAQPPAPAPNHRLIAWLSRHGLRTGLSGYWQADAVTLQSGGRVRIRAVRRPPGGPIEPGTREAKSTWYWPRSHRASFVVLCAGHPGCTDFASRAAVTRQFGSPAATHRVGGYLVLVWRANLLRELR